MLDEQKKKQQYKWATYISLIGSAVFSLLVVGLLLWKGVPGSKEGKQAVITFFIIRQARMQRGNDSVNDERSKKALQYKYASYLYYIAGVGGVLAMVVILFVNGFPNNSEANWSFLKFLLAIGYTFGGGVYMWKKYRKLFDQQESTGAKEAKTR